VTGALRTAKTVWNTFGAEGLRCRARFEVRKRLTLLRDAPDPTPPQILVSAPPTRWPFSPNTRRLVHEADRAVGLERADHALAGEYDAFRSVWRPLPANAEQWNSNMTTGYRYDPGAPWFRVPHFVSGSDIKDAWEPGRFSWVYDLVRGFLLTHDDRYARAFWTFLESFRAACSPFRGVQWACGQETAIRAVALLWAEAAFGEAPSTTPDRMGRLREVLWWSGLRIADALDYARSQRNNHGISECVGLIALGARFRSAARAADGWFRLGGGLLERQIVDQFAPDGWYVQHSLTYLRVALDQVVIAERVLRSAGLGIGPPARDRIRAATGFLSSVIDSDTGDVPNHGANDGAFVLPLTTRQYRDFRPSLTAAAATFHVALPAEVNPDQEMLAWLDADPPPAAVSSRGRVATGESGWVDVRLDGTRVFARAGRYRSRPSHVDALHLDVYVGGRRVAVDAGSYRYVGPWARALAEERAHNTIAIEGKPMAVRGPRFLWLRWPRARIASVREESDAVIIDLVNESWRDAGIEHRRQCHVRPQAVTVLDEIVFPADALGVVGVHWLLDGDVDDVAIVADVPTRRDVHRGDDTTPYGWISDSYAAKRAGTSVRLTTEVPASRVRFASGFGSARSAAELHAMLSNASPLSQVASIARRGSS
jgi:hypothetical protein